MVSIWYAHTNSPIPIPNIWYGMGGCIYIIHPYHTGLYTIPKHLYQ